MKSINSYVDGIPIDLSIFLLRITIGTLMFLHGIGKLMDLVKGQTSFFDSFDPFGLGGTTMLTLVVFSEFFCSLLLIAGILTRIALIPLIFTMSIAFFVFHSKDDLIDKELPLLYLVIFIFFFITGPGKYSLDKWKR